VFFTGVRAAIDMRFEHGFLYHTIGTAVAGVVWLLGSRASMTIGAMRWLDAIGTWLICASFAAMAVAYANAVEALGLDVSPPMFIALLATTYTLITRAIAVPSTPGRTAAVGSAALVPFVLATAYVTRAHPSSQTLATAFVDLFTWQLAAVALSAVASRVIFGLRAEAAANRKLGQYTLDEKIGEGGMGVVYRAHHAMLRRPTAIKLLPPEKAGAENLVRFEREVQLDGQPQPPGTPSRSSTTGAPWRASSTTCSLMPLTR